MTTGDDRPENIGDRLVMIETAIAYLVARQSDVEQLTDATDRLAESTVDLDAALRSIGQVKEEVAQKASQGQVETVRKQATARTDQLGRLVARLISALVVLLVMFVVGAAVAVAVISTNRAQLNQLHRLEQADAALQRGTVEAEAHNRFIDNALRAERLSAACRKLASDLRFLGEPLSRMPAECASYLR